MTFGFTIKRYRDDIIMDNPSNSNNYKNRTTKRKINTNITSAQDLPKNENSKSITNKKTKNRILKSEDSKSIHSTGKELIEQAFSDNKNNQEENKRFITIARKKVDNV